MSPRKNLQGWRNEQAHALQKLNQQPLILCQHDDLLLNKEVEGCSNKYLFEASDDKEDLYKEQYGPPIFDVYANEDLIFEDVDPICDLFDGEDLSDYVYKKIPKP
ncbi:hypothetical protein F2Q69_00028177 [Brassica cretica]|uniref:Uncharacterized protein n=1 Tax=Brassica cretica TaxID=69181 RepID=A0A8S9RRD5_BRACR|nr:hypothetical protein F2Q69_00028177 [Brassica cretica]